MSPMVSRSSSLRMTIVSMFLAVMLQLMISSKSFGLDLGTFRLQQETKPKTGLSALNQPQNNQPTNRPSSQPIARPSSQPTVNPTSPSAQPSSNPTSPTAQPSSLPSTQPSTQPSSQPTNPTSQPSVQPSSQPSRQPTGKPSRLPSSLPSSQPTAQPFNRPTTQPSEYPSSQPSEQPSSRPSSAPSLQPSSRPSGQPSRHPTSQPSKQPSFNPSRAPSTQPPSQPSRQPSNRPTCQPSRLPTAQPTAIPSRQPTHLPSRQPTSRPTLQPFRTPTTQPSAVPSRRPTRMPSRQPSSRPTCQPSGVPTTQPSTVPSEQPTRQPTNIPSSSPSLQPSSQPTHKPSQQPTQPPSSLPSCLPTSQPSNQPTEQPTDVPSGQPTSIPTTQPSAQPTGCPSNQPSSQPSSLPTMQPSSVPTQQPTNQPSSLPSAQPSVQPSSVPSQQPTSMPSGQPSSLPSSQPSGLPTAQPSSVPTTQPSIQPSAQPSQQPTSRPSSQPSKQPSLQPTIQPSNQPTVQPTTQPSLQPSAQPSSQPSMQPSAQPSSEPTSQPTQQPTSIPSTQPSSQPTMHPSAQPSAVPSSQPSVQPSSKPTGQPSSVPTTQPSVQPTAIPSTQPSSIPTIQPTEQPTAKPSMQPSSQPSSRPSRQPSMQPSMAPSTQPSSNPTNPTTQPTSQPSIDLAKVVPILDTTKTYVRVNTTSVTVSLTMTFASYYGGRIYCYASTNATTSPIRPVFVSPYYVDYVVGTLSTQVTIKQLVSLTSYYLYCGVRNFLQITSTNTEILSSVVRTTTACCKSITVTAAPSYVFNNGTLYLSGATTQSNIFSFRLDNVPTVQLILTPELLDEAGENQTQGVEFRPSSLTFTSSSTNSVASFALLMYNITGRYTIELQLSGSSALEYYSTSVEVRAADAANVPTPTLTTALFGDNGANIYFVFGSRTNYATLSGVWSCTELFRFAGANRTSCQWVNSTTVLGIFPTTNTNDLLTVGGNVTLIGNRIRASCVGIIGYCPLEKSPTQFVFASSPLNPITPSISIQTSNHVPSCENITIDATATTGSAGRPWKNVTWTISAANGFPVTQLKPYFDANSDVEDIKAFTINTYRLKATTYYAALSVENYLGQKSSQSTFFVYGVNSNMPFVTIQGPPSITISADTALKLMSTVTQSICSTTSTLLEYEWEVTLSGVRQDALNSTSKNPKIFSLPAYSLTVGNVYTVRLTVTSPDGQGSYISGYSATTVQVVSGDIVAVIAGGNKFLVSSDTTLDASSSYDSNTADTTTSFSYLWSCTSLSLAFFGQSCDATVFNGLTLNRSTVLVRPTYLNASTSYQITVLVTSEDGRFDTSTATVSAVLGYSNLGMVSITSDSSQTINEDQQLSIEAVVNSNASLLATWSALVDVDTVVLPTTLGPTYRNFSRAVSNMPFNLIIPGNTFLSGSTVTLRLSLTTGADAVLISYAEITISINTSPTGGTVVSTPQNGTALETSFKFITSSWVVDEAALPLTYTYQYQLSDSSPILTIKVRSQSNILFSTLPPGSEADNYAVEVGVVAYDANLAKGYTQQVSYVVPQTSSNYTGMLATMLANPNTLADPDQTLNILNVVGSTMNVQNCSSASPSYCASLNRNGCLDTPNTCGSCLANFTGVYGDSNTLCVADSGQVKLQEVGELCTSNTECIYGVCSQNLCIAPLQTCPIADNVACSGQGECVYRIDGNAVPQSECTVTTTACIPSCQCFEGFGGIDCSLNSTDLANRESSRITLCTTLYQVLSYSDYSSELLDNLAGTLLNSFSPYEVTSDEGFEICLNATTQLLSLAASGYLDVTSSSTTTNLLSLISNFASKSSGFGIAGVDSSATSLVSSVMTSMITGQTGLEYTTSNLKVTITRTSVDDLTDANITSPVTSLESAYGKVGTQVMLVGNSSQYCNDGTGFASLSVGSWGSNPYADSSHRFGSNVMRFQSSSVGTISYYNESLVNNNGTVICNETVINNTTFINCTTIHVTNTTSVNSTNRHLTTINALVNVTATPAYYIRYPFTVTQTFGSGELNYSIPECSRYNEYNEAVPCSSCNVSIYDNVSITFACFDITELCGGVAKSLPLLSGRRLQGTTNDDATQKLSIAQIGALLRDLRHEIASVLSSNPFRINLEKAKGILAFVGSLIVAFLVGIVYFRAWDLFDRSQIIYVERHKFANQLPKANSPYKLKKGISAALVRFEQEQDRFSPRASRRLQRGLSRAKTEKLNTKVVAQILDSAIPLEKLDPTSGSWFSRQFQALMEHHEYIYMVGGSSLIETRLIRWMNVTSNILVMLFLDTLFFGIFFPDTGTCESYFTQDLCLAPINAATNSNLCVWNGDSSHQVGAYCELNPPPQGIAFTMLLSTLSLLLLIPLTISFDIIRLKICAKRPDLDSIGLSSFYWLGLTDYELKYDDDVRDESQKRELSSPRSVSLRKGMSLREKSLTKGGLFELAERDNAVNLYFDELLARTAFADSASTRMEVDFLISDIRDFFSAGANQQPLTTERTYTVNRVQAKTIAVQKYLGLNVDGTMTRQSFIASFFLGSGRIRLENRLKAIRQRANRIEEKVLNAAVGGAMEPEISLIQHFVLEQFPAYKQFTLRYHFFDFPNSNAATINPYLWFAGWFYLIGAQLFFIYWIFAWCVSSGGKTFFAWGNNEILNVLQDIFLVQVMQVYLIYISTIATIVPQLRSIYCRLYEVAVKMDKLKASGVLDELRVVQYLSPTCRAARKSKVSKLRAANILRCLDDIDVQYCRQLDRRTYGFWAILAIALPGVLSYFGQSLGDIVFKAIFPSSISGIVLIFWFFYNVSIILCFVLVAFLIMLIVLTRGKVLQNLFFNCSLMCKSRKEREKARRKLRRKHSTQYKRISGDAHAVELKKRWQRRLQETYAAFISHWYKDEKRNEKNWLHMNLPAIDRLDMNDEQQQRLLHEQNKQPSFQLLRINTKMMDHEEESTFTPLKATASMLLSDDIREFRSVLMNLVADELHPADRRFAAIKMKNTYAQLPELIKEEHRTIWQSSWDINPTSEHEKNITFWLAMKFGLLPDDSAERQPKQQAELDAMGGGLFVNSEYSSPRHHAYLQSASEREKERLRREQGELAEREARDQSGTHVEQAPGVEFNVLFPSNAQEPSLVTDHVRGSEKETMSHQVPSAIRGKSIRFRLPDDAADQLESEAEPAVTRQVPETSMDEKVEEIDDAGVQPRVIEAQENKNIPIAVETSAEGENKQHEQQSPTKKASSPVGPLLSMRHFSIDANEAQTMSSPALGLPAEPINEDSASSTSLSSQGVQQTPPPATDFFAAVDFHEEEK